MIPKSQDLDTVGAQKLRSCSIIDPVFILIMLTAVQLYRQFYGRTIKIKNIGADAVLPEKFHSMESPVSHMRPESLLGFGLVSAQFTPALLQGMIIAEVVHTTPTFITPPGPLLT